MKNVLYIEDDEIDILQFKKLVSDYKNINVFYASNLQIAIEVLTKNEIAIIVSDACLGLDNIEDFEHYFGETPYYILSNHPDLLLQNNKSLNALKLFSKPLSKNTLAEVLNISDYEEEINISFFDQLTDDLDLKMEMLNLLINDMQAAKEKLEVLSEDFDQKEMKMLLHKISGKFATLNMTKIAELARKMEQQCVYKIQLHPSDIDQLKQGIISANSFLLKTLEENKIES